MARRGLGNLISALRRVAAGHSLLRTRPNAVGAHPFAVERDGYGDPPAALVIDRYLPTPDVDSGSVRMEAILRILAELGYAPAIISDDFDRSARAYDGAAAPRPSSVGEAIRWITKHRQTIRIVIISRHTAANQWMPLIRHLLPQTPIIFDTVDLHYLRESRQAQQMGSRVLGALARLTERRETRLAAEADRTWVVSEFEKQALEDACPGVRVDLVSNILDVLPHCPGYATRRNFVFLGNFGHAPNVDAVEWLTEWWPLLRERLPNTRLRIVGGGMPESLARRLASIRGIDVVGHVPRIEPDLLSARVMLAPLRYGAGVKGKVNAAFCAGLPVVGTPCAVEGMFDHAAPAALVADTSQALVDAAVTAYEDESLWRRLSDAGVATTLQRFSVEAGKTAVCASLASLGLPGSAAP